jgi:hypothetical protein
MAKTVVKKPIPFEFVLEELTAMSPYTKPMFGCTAVYVGDKIVLILRERGSPPKDDGVWLATTVEHHVSLIKDFPKMRSIEVFGPGVTGWQVLSVHSSDFEESVMRACELIRSQDPRIGKLPKSKTDSAKKGRKIPKPRGGKKAKR